MIDFMPTGFHFIRPEWLFALIPSLLFFSCLLAMKMQGNQWSRAVSRDLLPYLLDGGKSGGRSGLLAILLAAWTVASIAMAGPAWNKLPLPVLEKEDALVIIQDLSLSMFAQDLSPDRMTRARHKLTDILKKRNEGVTALIAYSAEAHTIVPLTDDIRTIENMVPALSPAIMPGYGSNVAAGVRRGLELISAGGGGRGRMLLITDEVTAEDVRTIPAMLEGRPVTLSVIGVGSENGGPIPMKDGGFWKDANGTIIVPTMDRRLLKELAAGSGGRYSDITLTDADIDYLLASETLIESSDEYKRLEREFDTWQDMGSRIVLLLLPLALFAFRRGLIVVLFLAIIFTGGECRAMSWPDLWLTRDQQAAKAMQKNDFSGAAETFREPGWKGAARYRAGDYEKAAEMFSGLESADGFYNLGNALAKGGQLNEAIQSYKKALELAPEMNDARDNLELVEKLLREQQQQQKDQQGGQGKEDQQGGQDKKGENQARQQGGQDGQSGQEQGDRQQESPGEKGEERGDQQEKGTQQDDQEQGEQGDQAEEGSGDASQDADKLNNEQKQKHGDPSEEKAGQDKSDPVSHTDGDEKGEAGKEEGVSADEQPLSEEELQAIEQVLRNVPDDPGGLLRRKFEYEYQQNRSQNKSNNNSKIW
ncbi:MAG: VWA domain-containing protein [Proteobacteria bacterium]|nr:VWA domain-containing protein [Pseudomonadota bacterium]MBU1736711.1 VWA domain-containing protein [Pseudomonadota bacterium]